MKLKAFEWNRTPHLECFKFKTKAGESAAVLLLRCLPTAKKAHTGFICSQVTIVTIVIITGCLKFLL